HPHHASGWRVHESEPRRSVGCSSGTGVRHCGSRGTRTTWPAQESLTYLPDGILWEEPAFLRRSTVVEQPSRRTGRPPSTVHGRRAPERVRAAAADVVATTIENLASTTIFFRSLHQLSEEKQKEVRRERRRYHETFRDMVVEGQQAGVFRGDVSAELAVDYFFGSVHHL